VPVRGQRISAVKLPLHLSQRMAGARHRLLCLLVGPVAILASPVEKLTLCLSDPTTHLGDDFVAPWVKHGKWFGFHSMHESSDASSVLVWVEMSCTKLSASYPTR
jgi:hypothetical protein